MNLFGGTLLANGLDHAGFPLASSLSLGSDVVISNQGSPMLMQTSLLRGLFSAGANVGIDANGVISATGSITASGTGGSGSSIDTLKVVTGLTAQDLVAVSQTGSDCAITYGNFLDGITIDQAQTAAAAGDTDTTWVAQGGNVLASQTFAAIWQWIANKLPTYKIPLIELTANTNLSPALHNGRLLICSQPITLTPVTSNMGSGFQCIVINASSGNLTLGSGFVSSSGILLLTPWQSATLLCATYSGGTIAFAAMPGGATAAVTLPGQAQNVVASSVTSSALTLSWQAPASGGVISSYIVQYRVTGTASWLTSPSLVGATTYQLTALQPGTSYDIVVLTQNTAGNGAASSLLTVITSAATTQVTLPPQVTGLSASPTSSSAIQLTWSAQTGLSAATTFTVQYRATGSSSWTSSRTGLTGTTTTITTLQSATSYDFEVMGLNAAGTGAASAIVTAVTQAGSVSSIAWNLLPSGPYTHGSGAIGVNAQVSPASSAIQFGFSQSTSTMPATWTSAILVNSNLWGAYVPTPATAGNWYVWAEGLDGSAATVSPTAFVVQ